MLGRNLQEKVVEAEQEWNFWGRFLLGGKDLEGGSDYYSFSLCFRATTKTVVSFFEEKRAPPEKNPGYAMRNNSKLITGKI